MRDDRVVQPAPHPGGRPRVEEPRTSVSAWLPARKHDRLIQLANRHEQSLSATLNQLIDILVPDEQQSIEATVKQLLILRLR